MIYAANLWASGFINSNPAVAANTYFTRGFDISYGPVAQLYDNAYDEKYDRVWKIDKNQIDNHIANYQSPGYTADEVILNWPAHGNTANGEAAILAPFYDVNQNGFYDPYGGDYPLIKGDQAVYFICNDARFLHTETGGNALQLEIHGMAYGYNSADENVKNTIFLAYKAYNRGSAVINDFKLSMWTDFDMGNPMDDLMACDSANSMVICYNGDADDEGALGFGVRPPAIGIKFLSESMSGSINYNNSTAGGNPAATSDPGNPMEFMNYMNQLWKNGDSLRLELPNGDGFTNNTSFRTTKFQYNIGAGWTSSTSNLADLRNVSSSGSVRPMPGESHCLEFAYIAARDTGSADLFASVDKLFKRADSINDFYNGNTMGCLEAIVSVKENQLPQLKIYPNPVRDFITVKNEAGININQVDIYNLKGQKLLHFTDVFEKMDISPLPKGFYLVKIKAANEQQVVEKFLKQ